VIVQVYASGGFKRQLISSAASRYPLVLDVRVGFYEPKRPFTGMGFSRSAGIAAGALQGLLAPIVVPKKRAMADHRRHESAANMRAAPSSIVLRLHGASRSPARSSERGFRLHSAASKTA
jgi:hypothetical protein